MGPTATVRGRVSRSGAADAHGRSRRLGVGGGLVSGDRSLNDTADLVAAHHDQIRLSAINSGATQWPSTPPRGPMTFLTIEDFPLTERRYGRTLDTAIAELAVIGGVLDIAAHVVTLQRRRGLDVTAELPLTAAQAHKDDGSRS